MKKVFSLTLLSLFASVSMVAQSASEASSVELKKHTEIKSGVVIERSNIKPAVKLESQIITKAAQPVKKEEETKSIETKQK